MHFTSALADFGAWLRGRDGFLLAPMFLCLPTGLVCDGLLLVSVTPCPLIYSVYTLLCTVTGGRADRRRLNPRLGVGWTAAKLTFEHALFLARAAEEKMRFLSFSVIFNRETCVPN